MARAISAGHTLVSSTINVFCRLSLPSSQSSMGQRFSSFQTGSSGVSLIKDKGSRRPGRFRRIPATQKKLAKIKENLDGQARTEDASKKKRKAEDDLAGASKAAKSNA